MEETPVIKVFVDGHSGTTGLKIDERLSKRTDIELLTADPEKHREISERKRLLNEADLAFLCLPDTASREDVSLIENPKTRVIDTSTAFRTALDWVYGFPELEPGQNEKIKNAAKVAVPGCHATGFNAAVHPLVYGGILGKDYPLCCQSVSGYSGGGKKLIAQYESDSEITDALKSPRFYSLALSHKHLPEMMKINGLHKVPLFTPIVGNFYEGMLVSLPLCRDMLKKPMDARQINSYYKQYYINKQFIEVIPFGGGNALDGGFLDACGCNGTNRLQIFVFGHDDEILVVSRLDNLGKGASGAAVQCMNIMIGADEGMGL